MMNQQEASLAKGLVPAGASTVAGGLAAGHSGGFVTQAMGRQFGGERERFGAMRARVGASIGGVVRVAVGHQLGEVAERLGAIGRGGRVCPKMCCQLGAVAEGLAAVRVSSAVREALCGQFGPVRECLGAAVWALGRGLAGGAGRAFSRRHRTGWVSADPGGAGLGDRGADELLVAGTPGAKARLCHPGPDSNRVSLCSPGCPGTRSVEQSGPKLKSSSCLCGD